MIVLQPQQLQARSLIKIRVTCSGDTWVLQPVEDSHGKPVPHRKEVILRGDDGVMVGFLAEVKAKDDEVLPHSELRLSHWDMVEHFREGLSKFFWVRYGDWVKAKDKYPMIYSPGASKEGL